MSSNTKEYIREYRKNNPEYVEKQRIRLSLYRKTPTGRYQIYKSNAIRRGFSFNLTLKEFLKIVSNNCFYCGDSGYGIDRINNTEGYLHNNIVSCCTMCNMMKKEYDINQFIEQCIKIANKYNK